MLSARTLACFLASQDDPEKGLCPHESVISAEARELKRLTKEALLHTRTKPALRRDDQLGHDLIETMLGKVGPVEGETDFESSPGERSNVQHRDDSGDGHGNPMSHRKLHKEKDPKSFTQSLFDTAPLKLLQAYIPDQYLQWSPSLKRAESPSTNPSDYRAARKDPVPRKKHATLNSNTPLGLDATSSISVNAEAVQPVMSAVKYPSTTHWSASANQRDKRGKRASVSGVIEKQPPLRNDCEAVSSAWKRSTPVTATGASKSPISQQGKEPSFTSDGPTHSEIHGDLEVARTALRLKDRKRAVSWTGLESRIRRQEHPPSVELFNVKHSQGYATSNQRAAHPRNSPGVSEQPTHESWKPAETLSHLTPENVNALVRMVMAAEPSLCNGRLQLRSIGRTDTTYLKPTALIGGSSTEVERTLAFGVQSLTYVLGNAAPLLKSFLCRAACEVVPDVMETRSTINAEDLLYQFRNLMEIDHHPRTVLPSLWVATGVLFNAPLAHSNPRSSDLRAGTALLKARQDHSSTDISDDLRNEAFLDDTDAAHIVKIVFAALGATIPKSNPETWLAVQKLRASGHVAPEVLAKTWDSHIVRSLLETMDAFEDEAALALITRLVRAISARRCMSEMAKTKKHSRRHDSVPANVDHDMINSILGFFTQDEANSTDATEDSTKTSKFLASRQGGVNDYHHESPKDTLTVR